MKNTFKVSSWVCLGNLNRSSPTLDDSSWTYQTASPQPFVAFLNPSTYQWLFRIRCGVNSSILIESFDGIPIQFVCRPTRKRSSTRFSLRGSHQLVSELRLFLVWIIYLESFNSCQFWVKQKKNQFLFVLVDSWIFLLVCSWTVLNFVVNFSFCVLFLGWVSSLFFFLRVSLQFLFIKKKRKNVR